MHAQRQSNTDTDRERETNAETWRDMLRHREGTRRDTGERELLRDGQTGSKTGREIRTDR